MIKESRRREKEKNKANSEVIAITTSGGRGCFHEACRSLQHAQVKTLRAEANCFDAHWLRSDDTPT